MGLLEPSKIRAFTRALYIGVLIKTRNAERHDRWAMQWHRLHFRDDVGKLQSTPAGPLQIADCASNASPVAKIRDRRKKVSQQMEKEGERKLQVCAWESSIWLLAAAALLAC